MFNLAATQNFAIQYADNVNKDGSPWFPLAPALAQALRLTCESDLLILERIFDVTNVFAGTGVTVTIGIPSQNGAGWNSGYKSAPNWSDIIIDGKISNALPKEYVRSVFVHELSELLMDYRNQVGGGTKFWLPMTSAGDGLAKAVSQWLHPKASGNDVEAWMNGPRDVSCLAAPASDHDRDSDDGTYLFIRYLEQQLGYSRTAIATRGGDTPEMTFQNLTGRSGGGAEMLALLARYFGAGPNIKLVSVESPFPLLDPPARTLRIDVDKEETSTSKSTGGVVTVSPAPGCPEGTYTYDLYDQDVELTCTAVAVGAGQPSFSWRVNGLAINPPNGALSPVLVEVRKDDPQHPGNYVLGIDKVTINYRFYDAESTLVLSTSDHVGRVFLTVEARMSERLAGNGETVTATLTELVTQRVAYREPFEFDRERCLATREVLAKSQMQPVPWFSILRTLPDPPPEPWMSIGFAIDRARAELKQLSKSEPRKAAEMQTILETRLGLPRGLLAPSPDQTTND